MKYKFRRKKKKKYYCSNIIIILILSTLIIFIIFIFPIFKSYSKKNLNKKSSSKKEINYNRKEIIDDYLYSIPSKYQHIINSERHLLEKYLNLKDLSKETNEKNISEIKRRFRNIFISLFKNQKNITDIKYLYFKDHIHNHFGNKMVILNNLIYYCEILGFNNIYLSTDNNWYIKNKIFSDKINISLESPRNLDCNSKHIACFKPSAGIFFFQQNFIKPQIRLNLIKNEIKKNLPQIEINSNDLYIHIRSGDIFRKRSRHRKNYAQPPLCFYQNIINNFKFRKIYIIAVNRNNLIINKLINEYPNVIYEKHNLALDISYLSNAYNLVASVSSFLLVVVKFNDNLIKYFEYDIYVNSEKILHLHHDFYYFPIKFTIYKMKPSIEYKNEMFRFSNKKEQYKLMIDEKCINNFTEIKPNI